MSQDQVSSPAASEGEDTTPFLPLKDMSIRHRALTLWLAGSYLEAASVCLDQHHQKSPKTFILEDNHIQSAVMVAWESVDRRTKEAWANQDDATRDGAYSMAIAAVELSRAMYAIRRAETRTGADYYVAPATQDLTDLENWFRLEISGTSLGEPEARRRLKTKLEQAKKGNSNLPAVASVVGFRVGLILLQTLDGES